MGVKLIGLEKLEAKLTKNMDLSAVRNSTKYRDTWICGWNIKA